MAPPPKGSVTIRYSMASGGLRIHKHMNLWGYSLFHPHHSIYLPPLNLLFPQCQKQNKTTKKTQNQNRCPNTTLAQPTKRTKTKGQESRLTVLAPFTCTPGMVTGARTGRVGLNETLPREVYRWTAGGGGRECLSTCKSGSVSEKGKSNCPLQQHRYFEKHSHGQTKVRLHMQANPASQQKVQGRHVDLPRLLPLCPLCGNCCYL